MKSSIHIHILPFVLATVALLSGCNKEIETEIADLKERIRDLEAEVAAYNKDCQTLSDLASEIEQNDLISKVEKMSDGSYRIVFASGKIVSLKDGKDGEVPILGIKRNERDSSVYYWTVRKGSQGKEELLKDSGGNIVRASTNVPKLWVEETGGKEYWYYSIANGAKLLLEVSGKTAHGYSGSSMFKTVDCSNEAFVKIILASNDTLRIPTQAGFDRLNVMCDTINNNMSIINGLIQGIDTMIFINEVRRVENEGEPAGYDIVFADGRTFSLRDGIDSTDIKTLSIGWNDSLSMNCWEIDGEPIMYGGKALEAGGFAPTVGVVAMDGAFYFTVAVGGGEPEVLLDSEGNPVQASPARFFESIEEKDGGIELTLTGVGDGGSARKVILVKAEDCTPYLHLSSQSEWKVSRNDGKGSFTAAIDSLGINSIDEFTYELEAVAVEGARVDSISTGALTDASPKKSIEHQIYFSLDEGAAAGDTIRVAVFLSWGGHTIMKVGEMTVTEDSEGEE